ncbi:zinc-binding dehydrogenase [Pseudonocardia sp. MH-G8]|uniref:zinc-binding dehydrogenase n=1 Tax=Pseudonocardia sp. MH-G8 TaxID=1854588 RepID=UPI000BA149C3|nr:zinc-binding dehydrogenase [Pseudonocardia sp. MH-G8]OZM82985.1 NADPH:quinone reductase [Pseudonocardia sp. MH-G8]
MQQIVVERFGGPEVLVARDAPDPVAASGEVVVAVRAADTLWIETVIRSGDGRPHWPQTPPYVPGNAVAGHVLAVGSGVDPGLLGRAVVARTGGTGGYAEQVAVRASEVTPVPDGVDLQVAAALLHDGVTALALLEITRIGGEDRVLVVGASGGLGIVAVQLAKARGATVVATARDERKIARVRELGVDAVIDSEAPDWVDRARRALGGTGATVVLDNIGGTVGEAAFTLVEPGGRFSAHGTPSGRFTEIDPAEAQRRGVRLTGIADVQLSPDDVRRLTAGALAEAAAGGVAPVIGQTHPLTKAADAHAGIEARTVFGKTLLTVAP